MDIILKISIATTCRYLLNNGAVVKKEEFMEKNVNIRKFRVILYLIQILSLYGLLIVNSSYGEIISQDRRVTWQGNVGVEGGIPTRSVCVDITKPPADCTDCLANRDGITNDVNQINNAINYAAANCPANSRVVFLPAGNYAITTGTINLNNYVVLRGEGPAHTIIKGNFSTGNDNAIVSATRTARGNAISITSGFSKGSDKLTLFDASTISTGDYLIIDQNNDNTITNVSINGGHGDCTWCDSISSGARALGQISKVTGKAGNDITISPPLSWDFVIGATPQVRKMTTTLDYVGLENLKIGQYGSGLAKYIISYGQCVNCWVKNIETFMARTRHIQTSYSFRNEFRDSYFHEADSYGQDHGYDIELWNKTSSTLIENNIFADQDIGVSLVGGGAYNVIAYNYFTNPRYTIEPARLSPAVATHGAHPAFTLLEGNIMYKVQWDSYWGSSSHQTVFRNWISGEGSSQTTDLIPVYSCWSNRDMNFIGNILGSSGKSYLSYELENTTTSNCRARRIYKLGYDDYGNDNCTSTGNDPLVIKTILRHGNYDYYNKAVVWNSSIIDHNLPNSYYLTSKPSFFRDKPWPIIGPDLDPMVGTIPAEERFHAPSPPKL